MSYPRSHVCVLALLAGMVIGLARPVWAFECPEPQAQGVKGVIPESKQAIGELSALLRSGDLENDVEVTARKLKQKYPNADQTELTNFMVTAYCPVISSEQGLRDSEKRARLEAFSERVWQIYSDLGS